MNLIASFGAYFSEFSPTTKKVALGLQGYVHLYH
jgi:hypothetical protein